MKTLFFFGVERLCQEESWGTTDRGHPFNTFCPTFLPFLYESSFSGEQRPERQVNLTRLIRFHGTDGENFTFTLTCTFYSREKRLPSVEEIYQSIGINKETKVLLPPILKGVSVNFFYRFLRLPTCRRSSGGIATGLRTGRREIGYRLPAEDKIFL